MDENQHENKDGGEGDNEKIAEKKRRGSILKSVGGAPVQPAPSLTAIGDDQTTNIYKRRVSFHNKPKIQEFEKPSSNYSQQSGNANTTRDTTFLSVNKTASVFDALQQPGGTGTGIYSKFVPAPEEDCPFSINNSFLLTDMDRTAAVFEACLGQQNEVQIGTDVQKQQEDDDIDLRLEESSAIEEGQQSEDQYKLGTIVVQEEREIHSVDLQVEESSTKDQLGEDNREEREFDEMDLQLELEESMSTKEELGQLEIDNCLSLLELDTCTQKTKQIDVLDIQLQEVKNIQSQLENDINKEQLEVDILYHYEQEIDEMDLQLEEGTTKDQPGADVQEERKMDDTESPQLEERETEDQQKCVSLQELDSYLQKTKHFFELEAAELNLCEHLLQHISQFRIEGEECRKDFKREIVQALDAVAEKE